MPAWLPFLVTWVISTLAGAGIAYGVLRQRLQVLEQEVGTRNSGLRGAVHDHTQSLLKLDGRVTSLEQQRK